MNHSSQPEQGELLRIATSSGDAYLQALARHLVRASAAEYAYIAHFDPPGAPRLTTLVLYQGETSLPNLSFDFSEPLWTSAWPHSLAGSTPLSAENVSEMTLTTRKGAPLGVMAILGKTPLPDREGVQSLLGLFADRTAALLEERRALKDAEKSLTLMASLLDGIPHPILFKDREGQYLACNSATEKMLGFSREEIVGKTLSEVAPEDLQADCCLTEQKILSGEMAATQHEAPLTLPDGEIRQFLIYKAAVTTAEGKIEGVACSFLDMTERSKAGAELENKQKFLQNIIDSVLDPIKVIGTDKKVLLLNAAARRPGALADCTGEEMTCRDICHAVDTPCQNDVSLCPIEEVLRRKTHTKLLQYQRGNQGETELFEVVAAPFWSDEGELQGVIHWGRNVSERASMQSRIGEQEDRLQFLAYHDPLTRLPNRLLFQERLTRAMSRSRRTDQVCALVFVDIDRFRVINDSLGHDIGDLTLIEIGRLLLKGVRETDTVARFGGDEFMILLEGLEHQEQIAPVVRKILALFDNSIRIRDIELFVTASVGICLFPHDAHDVESMIKNAEIAMYRGKTEGQNTYAFYRRSMDCRAHDQYALEMDLRRGINEGEMRLFYQPQIDLCQGKVAGFEGLMRWLHPQRGTVSPNEFIPLAEETGLIVSLGESALDQACRFIRRRQDLGRATGNVAVNISPRHFRQPGFVEMVTEVLTRTRVNPRHLELEITEGMIMDDRENATRTMGELSRMGVGLAIDDFGTGYSSLGYLKRFPVNTLKIDRSFVTDLSRESNDEAIITAIMALAESMKLRVLAEGVESDAQLKALRGYGCNLIQGYFFSAALPENEALTFEDSFRM